MTAPKALSGRRIVITRAIDQARELKDRLEALGANVLLLPAVSFSEPADATGIDRAIHSLGTFDWILFTSANAVKFFAERCHKLGLRMDEMAKPQCAAVGPATAKAAAAEGFIIDYVALEFAGIALAHELASSLASKTVLLPRSQRAGQDLIDALQIAGAKVTEVVAYHTGGIGAVESEIIEEVREAHVDVVSFFSPSAVENLRSKLGAEAFAQLGAKAAFAAVGPVTAAALRKAGQPAAIEAQEATTESMVTAITNYFSSRTVSQARSS